jgi:predicted secreted protein
VDKRSNHYALVAFCLLAQGVRAQSLVKLYPGAVEPIISWLMQHGYNILQMPCPELFFDDVNRRPCGKSHYDRPECHTEYTRIAQYLTKFCQRLETAGNQIDLILGVERSPSCAIFRLTAPGNRGGHPQIVNGQGFFTDALKLQFESLKHRPQFIGVDTLNINATILKLKTVLE